MFTIDKNYKYELIVKKSRFICLLYKVNDISDIFNLLDRCKIEYDNANHYCYAYIINNIKKSSDDGEPVGSAGIPLLKVLDNNELTNVLVIVVRYFGGIKLGINGLIRAYTKSLSNCLSEANKLLIKDGFNMNISFSYSRLKEIDYLLRDIKINNKIFNDNIIYNIDISSDNLNIIIDNNINYEIIKKILI